MGLSTTQAVVLKSQRWGEADRIVTLFTEQLGKMRGVARGARRMKSRFGSALEPFAVINVTLFEKTSDALARISQAAITESFAAIRQDLPLMTTAARLVNATRAVMQDRDPSRGVYRALVDGLRRLNDGMEPGLCALVFQIHLLGCTGFRPQVDQCSECGRPIPMQVASLQFSAKAGGIICRSCGERVRDRGLPLSRGSIALMQRIRTLPFAKVDRLRVDGQARQELEQALDAYMQALVGRALPEMVVSRSGLSSAPDRSGRVGTGAR